MTPFTAGQQAARAGKPIEANPHSAGIKTGKEYPGDWANWRAGWRNETAMMKHDEELRI